MDQRMVRQYLDGQKEAARWIAGERAQRLTNLTTQDSFLEYQGLAMLWQRTRNSTVQSDPLEEAYLNFLVHRRAMFDKLPRG